MPYAGVALHKQNKYMDLFEAASAIDEKNAKTLEELQIKRDSFFDKMLSIEVFCECENGLFYMNADKAIRLRENRSGFHLWRLEKDK